MVWTVVSGEKGQNYFPTLKPRDCFDTPLQHLLWARIPAYAVALPNYLSTINPLLLNGPFQFWHDNDGQAITIKWCKFQDVGGLVWEHYWTWRQ